MAGGSGSRLYPVTRVSSKQLLPIYDKPMIYYPLSVLMLACIQDILIITTPEDKDSFKRLLGDGTNFGINLQYTIQPSPDGLAQAFIIGEEFIGKSRVCLILGDNIFYGNGIEEILRKAASKKSGANIFAHYVNDPDRYGVVVLNDKNKPIDLEEKPVAPKSNYAVTGIYMYDSDVIDVAKSIVPSARGELEITDVNKAYLEQGALKVEFFGRGTAWLDTGTTHSLLDAANFIRVLEERQGLKIGCPEETAYRQKFIDKSQLRELAENLKNSGYGQYLLGILGSR